MPRGRKRGSKLTEEHKDKIRHSILADIAKNGPLYNRHNKEFRPRRIKKGKYFDKVVKSSANRTKLAKQLGIGRTTLWRYRRNRTK